MSLVFKHFDMVLEVTDDGELLFPEHDLEYDIAFTAMGGDMSREMAFLADWDNDPTIVFFSFCLNGTDRDDMLIVGRALVEAIILMAGVANVMGTSFENMGQEIYEAGCRALSGVSGDRIEELRGKMGWLGSGLQQQKWMMGGSGISWYFDPRIDPQRSAVDAATNYLLLIDMMYGAESYWVKGGRKKAIPFVDKICNGPLSELTAAEKQEQAATWHPGETPIPFAFVPAAKKVLVGAVVRALEKAGP